MTLLNGILAFGAAAFAIPLLIHLLNRSRFRTIPWGAMHLLESVVHVNSRRIRIEQLILLLVRCAIPVLLALCLARPVLTGWRALPGDAPTSTVILLDNSYSMDAATGDRSCFARAVDQSCDLIKRLTRGSDISVIATGGAPIPVYERPILDSGMMIQQLRRLPSGFGASDMATSLEAGVAALSSMANARRELILVSDFQRSDWETLDATAIARIRRQIEAMPLPPNVTLLRLGRAVDNNASIDSLSFSSEALGVGQPLHIRAHMRNHGGKSYSNARVHFQIDGAQRSVSQVTLPAHSAAQTLFTCQFDKPGSHVVEVEVMIDDHLQTDNRYRAAVQVLQQLPVLLVDGAPSSEPLKSETDFLAVALTPFAFGRVKLTDLIETTTVAVNKLTDQAIADASVVVLANVARLSDKQLQSLTEYVQGGGSLLIFVGNKINVDWYNRTLYDGGRGVLPVPIGALAGDPSGKELPTRIVAQHFDHPALQIFNNRTNGNLADAEIRRWYRPRPGSAGTRQSSAGQSASAGGVEPLVLAQFESGDPMMVERRVGEGIVVQVATACDADWSNLPTRPFYLPLMQHLVTTMALRVAPPRNIKTGDPIVAVFPGNLHDLPMSLTTPDGARHTVRATVGKTHSVVRYERTQQPGVYTLAGPDARPHHFVAEPSRGESDVRLLDEKQLRKVAGELKAQLVHSSEEYLQLDRRRRHGREIWRYLLFGVVGLLFLELFLQQRFTRVRT